MNSWPASRSWAPVPCARSPARWPDRSLISSYRFENLAGVEISADSYDPELTAETVAYLDNLPTAQGLGNVTGLFDFALFRVVWDPQGTPVPILRLWYFGDMMYFVDDRVLGTGSNR